MLTAFKRGLLIAIIFVPSGGILGIGNAIADNNSAKNAPAANTPAPPQQTTIAIPNAGSPSGVHGSVITNTTQPPSPQNPKGETGGAVGVSIPFNKK